MTVITKTMKSKDWKNRNRPNRSHFLGSIFPRSSESMWGHGCTPHISFLVTQGAHWSILAAVESWVWIEAPRQWLLGQVSNWEAKFCCSPIFSGTGGREGISWVCPIQPPPGQQKQWKEMPISAGLCLWCTSQPWKAVSQLLFSLQEGLNGVGKIGWADFLGMPGGDPSPL